MNYEDGEGTTFNSKYSYFVNSEVLIGFLIHLLHFNKWRSFSATLWIYSRLSILIIHSYSAGMQVPYKTLKRITKWMCRRRHVNMSTSNFQYFGWSSGSKLYVLQKLLKPTTLNYSKLNHSGGFMGYLQIFMFWLRTLSGKGIMDKSEWKEGRIQKVTIIQMKIWNSGMDKSKVPECLLHSISRNLYEHILLHQIHLFLPLECSSVRAKNILNAPLSINFEPCRKQLL